MNKFSIITHFLLYYIVYPWSLKTYQNKIFLLKKHSISKKKHFYFPLLICSRDIELTVYSFRTNQIARLHVTVFEWYAIFTISRINMPWPMTKKMLCTYMIHAIATSACMFLLSCVVKPPLTGTSHKRTTQYGSGNFSNKTQLTSHKRAPVVSECGHPFRGHGTKITSLIRTVEEKIAKLWDWVCGP